MTLTAPVQQQEQLSWTADYRRATVLPRWSIGGGYAVLWALGAGFLALPIVALRLVLVGRWRRPTIGIASLLVALPLAASLIAAAAGGARPSRLVAAMFLLVPWVVLALAASVRWTYADQRALARGLMDLSVVQGALVAVGLAAYPQGLDYTLPLGRVLPSSLVLTAPLDAWTQAHLAFPDFYGGSVLRTGGMFGNPTWAAAVAALAVLCLLLRPREVAQTALGLGFAVAVLAASGLTLVTAFSRNAVIALALGVLSGGIVGLLRPLRLRTRRLVCAGLAAAGVLAVVMVDVPALWHRVNAPRAGSLQSRQAIYAQTLDAVHRHSVLLGSGIKETGRDLVANLGTHSTYLGLAYRGGWPAFWAFVALLSVLLGLSWQRRLPLAAGLVVFTIVWSATEDLDAGHLVPLGLVLAVAALQRPRQPSPRPSDDLAEAVTARFVQRTPTRLTWLNHWSALRCLREAVPLERISLVGLDGNGLRWLLGDPPSRTSADLVLPQVLPRLDGARVAVLGGSTEGLARRVEALTALLGPRSKVVAARDGYEGLLVGDDLTAWVEQHRPNVLLLALGAPIQDDVLSRSDLPGVLLAATCGGWLDQVAHGSYYPRWAYPLRMNWLVRVAREPRRLWRRYTVWVMRAVVARRDLAAAIETLPGVVACRDLSDARLPVDLPVPAGP